MQAFCGPVELPTLGILVNLSSIQEGLRMQIRILKKSHATHSSKFRKKIRRKLLDFDFLEN